MKIELRTHAPALVPTIQRSDNAWIVGICHDALAAHARQEATEVARIYNFNSTIETCDFIETRAAELLASYLDSSSGAHDEG